MKILTSLELCEIAKKGFRGINRNQITLDHITAPVEIYGMKTNALQIAINRHSTHTLPQNIFGLKALNYPNLIQSVRHSINWEACKTEDLTQKELDGTPFIQSIIQNDKWDYIPSERLNKELLLESNTIGTTTYHILAQQGKLQTLPPHLIYPEIAQIKNHRGSTPMHLAILDKLPEKFLTTQNFAQKDAGGFTPLHAETLGNISILIKLSKYIDLPKILNIEGPQQETPLYDFIDDDNWENVTPSQLLKILPTIENLKQMQKHKNHLPENLNILIEKTLKVKNNILNASKLLNNALKIGIPK